jgi:hypothetical protein
MVAFLCTDLIEYPIQCNELRLAMLKAVPGSLLARKDGFSMAIYVLLTVLSSKMMFLGKLVWVFPAIVLLA